MNFLPISLRMEGLPILMIGAGKVALHKLKALMPYQPHLTLLSKEFVSEVLDLPYPRIQKAFEPMDLKGYRLVYACTNHSDVNAEIHRECKRFHIPVNVADNPELCDFISPAIYKHGEFSFSVSSSGTNVKKAIAYRDWIRKNLENDIENTIN